METGVVAFSGSTARSFAETLKLCLESLAEEGFGALTEIDIQATLKKKLDVDVEPYVILGACHPQSAYRALRAAPEVGVFLPCNVTVSVEGDRTVVRAMNPASAMSMLDSEELGEVAESVGAALARVVTAVTG
jgi:uncharacterized protein (DUF302 family)